MFNIFHKTNAITVVDINNIKFSNIYSKDESIPIYSYFSPLIYIIKATDDSIIFYQVVNLSGIVIEYCYAEYQRYLVSIFGLVTTISNITV